MRLGACGAVARLLPLAVLPALGIGALSARSSAAPPSLRGVEGLVRAYDVILEARFDQVEPELQRACGPAPQEACDVLAATALWWRILLDPENRSLDAEFTTSIDRAIETSEAWTERAPKDAEAWFYLGAAHAARVQFRVLRNEKLAAARDGKRIRDALDEAIALDPALDDAYFGLGMYKYYAAVAPMGAKILRALLLLPGGNKEDGLREMLRARDKGRLLQGEADYQLHIIYLWYERRTDLALQLLRSLSERYASNPLFLVQIADIQDTYQHDVAGSLATSRTLLAAAREHRVNAAEIAEVQARLGIAKQLEVLHQTDHAIAQLQAIAALAPRAPYASLALAHLRLGDAHDRVGDRPLALAAYRTAVSSVPGLDPYNVRQEATEKMRRTPDAKRAQAYRLSLEGWRRLEKNDAAGAAALLERSLALNPNDPVARYRYGRALRGTRNDPAALVQFEFAIRNWRTCPPPILATAYVDAARLHERAGRRDQAIAYYRAASTLFGAAADTRAAASRALARLQPK